MVSAPRELPASDASRAIARLRLRARRRVAWLQSLGGGEGTAPLDGADDPAAERVWRASDDQASAIGETLAALEAAPLVDESRLARLARVFSLDARELDYVEACLAVDLEPSFGRVLAWLSDHAGRLYPTESTVARIYEHGLARVLAPESPLLRWQIVRVEPIAAGEPEALFIDPLVRDWLIGQKRLDGLLVGIARLHAPRPALPRWPVEETAAWLQRILTVPGAAGRARVRVVGPPGSGRCTFAACAAERLGLPLLVVDADSVPDERWPAVFLAAHRQAFLDGCAIAWTAGAAARRWPDVPSPFPVQFVAGEAGLALPPSADTADTAVDMPALEVAERAEIWRQLCPAAGEWAETELSALAAQHRLTPGEIAAAAGRGPASAAEAGAMVRESSRHRLGDLARWIECPFGWDDLVLAPPLRQALDDLVFEARDRATFWEQPAARRLFPQGRALFALFTGTPGTGKTMAAQVIAAALGLDLFRISLAAVVSKYVGETAKNLQAILARAEAMDAVLLFDEADALFARRTEIKDAHDRFANTDTNYLLQAIEAYRGIAILASNKKANIDAAFTRRLRWVLDFPRPGAGERRALWERLVGELAGPDRAGAMAGTLDALAATVEVTGAQIKLAVLSGLFAARQTGAALDMRHLMRGLERELGKEGRALSERDRTRLVDA